ncbi:MAG: hypothetical protein EGQ63_08390 [Clostridiales bacterium]|nr:hypothetical protein [Clostridiales bacterium]
MMNRMKQWWNRGRRYTGGIHMPGMILLMVVLLTMKNSFMTTETERTLFYEIFKDGKAAFEQAGLIGTAVFQLTDIGNVSDWLVIFFPFIAGYSFVTVLCDDFQSGFVRLAAVRMGSRRYLRRMFRCGILAILVIGITALLLFGIFCRVTCLSIHDLPHEEAAMLYKAIWRKTYAGTSDPTIWNYIYPLLRNNLVILFVMLLEGLISFLLAAATKNKYFSLFVPCMVLYILVKTADSLVERGFGWAEYLSPAAWLVHTPALIVVLSLSIFIVVAAEEAFVRLLDRGVDCLAY